MPVTNLSLAVGRRKTAVARVYFRKGNGSIKINQRSIEDYFPIESQRMRLQQPLLVTASEKDYDILINVAGGGVSAQVGACVHGIARGLVKLSEGNRPSLRNGGFLTRDSRMVERKKYGKRGARRSTQFSKR